MSDTTGIVEAKLASKVASLLDDKGFKVTDLSIEPCDPGGNNRVFILNADGEKYLLKNYYSSLLDSRNRLQHEWSFLKYAKQIDIDCVPKPIACDEDNNIGIYEFIEGKKISEIEITQKDVQEAINFIHSLNNENRKKYSINLTNASEACFCIADHLALVKQRIDILKNIRVTPDLQGTLLFLINKISSGYEVIKNEIIKSGKKYSLSLTDELAFPERCVSPSDFGFHNAILSKSNKLYFLDFEYAGWDDPAKLISDFFCQPEIPVSLSHFDEFAKGILFYLEDKESHLIRAKIMMPLFKLKWCCIMLNEFLPDAWERRKFAKNLDDKNEHHVSQIKKVEKTLNQLNII